MQVVQPLSVILLLVLLLQFSGQGALTFYTAHIFTVSGAAGRLGAALVSCSLYWNLSLILDINVHMRSHGQSIF